MEEYDNARSRVNLSWEVWKEAGETEEKMRAARDAAAEALKIADQELKKARYIREIAQFRWTELSYQLDRHLQR